MVEPSRERTGLDVHLGAGAAPVASDSWQIGGWTIRFVRLDAHQTFTVASGDSGTATYVKVVTGRLVNLDRGAYAAAQVVRSTRVDADTVAAGADGAVFAIFTAVGDVVADVTAVSQLAYSGPGAEHLTWRSFESMYTAMTPAFDGVDAHLSPGFHLLDADGAEIAYLFVWAAGKGADMTTHNHGRSPKPTAPAFAEVHWVMHNGTGSGGMYLTPEPGAATRDRFPIQQGDEHGPFFDFDAETGFPILSLSGAVSYPWHGWQAGTDDRPGNAYDVVAAFEITAPYARVVP